MRYLANSLTFFRLFVAIFLLALGGAYSPVHAEAIQVNSADPDFAEQGTVNLDVLIQGNGFDNTAQAVFLVTGTENPGGITVNSTRARGSKKLLVNIDIEVDADVAKFDIKVNQSGGRTGKGTELFSVKARGASSCQVIQPLNPDFTRVATLRASSPVEVGLGRAVGAATLSSSGKVVAAVGAWMTTDTVEVFVLDPNAVAGVDFLDGSQRSADFSLDVPLGRYVHVAVADVNNDSFPDIVVGDWHAGQAFLFLAEGGDSTITGYEAAIELLPPPAEEAGMFGRSLTVGELIDGNMVNEIVVGAPGGSKGNSGKVFIFKLGDQSTGCPLTNFCITASLTIASADLPGDEEGGRFGKSVAVGDVGVPTSEDLIVAAFRADAAKNKRGVGKVWVFESPLTDTSASGGFLLAQGDEKGISLGQHVVAADLTGTDAMVDVVATDFEPEALVFQGLISWWTSPMSAAVVLLPDSRFSAGTGSRVELAVGLINADMRPDLIVGFPTAKPPGCNDTIGAAQVYLSDVSDSAPFGLLLQPPDAENGGYGHGVAAANTLVFVGDVGGKVNGVQGAGLVHVYKLKE